MVMVAGPALSLSASSTPVMPDSLKELSDVEDRSSYGTSRSQKPSGADPRVTSTWASDVLVVGGGLVTVFVRINGALLGMSVLVVDIRLPVTLVAPVTQLPNFLAVSIEMLSNSR